MLWWTWLQCGLIGLIGLIGVISPVGLQEEGLRRFQGAEARCA
jgi:hypothetical protein